MFCTACGTQLSEGSKFCSNCGASIFIKNNVKEVKSGKSRLNQDSSSEKEFEVNPSLVEQTNFTYESSLKVGLLCVVTFGIYYLFLLNKWIKSINAASEKDFIDPAVAIVITIVTLGAAAIYFDYQIVVRSEKLAKSTNGNSNPRRKNLTPPTADLKNIVLYGGIAVFVMQFTPALILSLIFTVYINISIQRALEYTFFTQNPN